MKTDAQPAPVEPAWHTKLGGMLLARGAEPHTDSSESADAMELGLAPGSTATLAQPLSQKGREQRLVVLRSPTRRVCALVGKDGATLLIARRSANGRRFDMFLPSARAQLVREGKLRAQMLGHQRATRSVSDHAADLASEPAFVLEAAGAELSDWTLTAKCERCEARGRRQCGVGPIARFVHYMQDIGPSSAWCMDVKFPSASAGGAGVGMCEACSGMVAQWQAAMTTRRPTWSAKTETLTLGFKGRVSKASAKNFQLRPVHGTDTTTLLFGKVEDQRFVLDYSAPMGMVQAFAASMSVSHWE